MPSSTTYLGLAFVGVLVYARVRSWWARRIYGLPKASLSLQVRTARWTGPKVIVPLEPMEFCKLDCVPQGILIAHSMWPHWMAVFMQFTLVPYEAVQALSVTNDTLQLKWSIDGATHILPLEWPPGGGEDGVDFCHLIRKRIPKQA